MEREDSDRDQCTIKINHFELKKQSEEDENLLNAHYEAPGEVMVSHLSDLREECLVSLENSRGEMTEEPEKISSSSRTRCSSCVLILVKCLDLLININIIGFNYLNFTIRNI